MKYSFHPNPVVGMTKIFILAIILTLIVYTYREILKNVAITFLEIIWIISLIYIATIFIMSRFYSITLDEKSVTYKRGIFWTKEIMLPYHRITEATYIQGIVQRILRVGTLIVDTAGGSHMAIHVEDIKSSDLKMIIGEIKTKSHADDGE
ncbi:PH domain-containing protein [Candidatus Micrarchaeota archaeon]|nr:PH domain-containing protein [Candidatus Micrarchaeota archaeon]MBU1886357.1 PH domain-containing protein [Candidatus Micrarchaeota archaeon]